MSRRILCLVLCLLLVLPGTALAREEAGVLRIHTLEGFLRFAKSCRLDSYSRDLQVYLETDLDLTGTAFAPIASFSGAFDGGGHRITGLNLTADGSAQGLFRYLTEGALVENLTVAGAVSPGGTRSQAGGLAGSNAGTIRRCTFEGQIHAGDQAGGLVGINLVTGIIEDCRTKGSVSGSHFVGGVAGENLGVIRGCVNQAAVNTTAQENQVELSDITLETMITSESAGTVTDVGGIAGISSGVIRDCENRGAVGYPRMGYNIGGIAGTQKGYMTQCRNLAEVQGRKEVGGIVGQMEPVALVTYDEDALQILRRQLSAMNSTISSTSANLQGTAQETYSQAEDLMGYLRDARDAVDLLLPDPSDPELPDEDTLQAAQNILSGSLSGMQDQVRGMAASTQTSLGRLSNNLRTLQSQINAMASTLDNLSETLGGSIQDVSDQDTPEQLSGKVSHCENTGQVLGDSSVGGIAGAMAPENDLDIQEDLDIRGENSLNFESQLRAVILSCENRGTVQGGKQFAGGIVGWQILGLVKDSRNTGALEAADALYAGGIAGLSQGYLRENSAKCDISAKRLAGGIAGSAAVVTDCRSMVVIREASEQTGAVLGGREEDVHEEETPIAGNYYLNVDADPGGIDGVSYDGLAQPLSQEEFFRLENLPDLFRQVVVTFQYENGGETRIALDTGAALEPDRIPAVPEKDGAEGSWEGLEEANLRRISFDLRFRAVYTGSRKVIESDVRGQEDLPVLLAEGEFPSGAQLTLEPLEENLPQLEKGQTLVQAWQVSAAEAVSLIRGRLQIPGDRDPERLSLWRRGGDGVWRLTEHTRDGSYLVFPMEAGDTALALAEDPSFPWLRLFLGLGGVLVLAAGLLIRRKAGKKRPSSG